MSLLVGRVEGHPAEPVAWINGKGKARIFYTSLGHPGDFAIPAFRRLAPQRRAMGPGSPQPENE